MIAPPSGAELLLSIAGPLLVLAAVTFLVVRYRLVTPGWLHGLAAHRLSPALVGALGAVATWMVWGSLREPGVVHDEQAYVLQAEIFASGRWVGERPPIVEFFEQVHVFVEPHLAAKYPPGHSLLLVPGVIVGLPGLAPLVMVGAAGALFMALARRLTDPMTALLATVLWSTSTTTLIWRASYLSQTSGTLLWLVALWGLLRWTETRQPRWLAVVAAGMGWLYLTRPLTGLALAVPCAVVIVRGLPGTRPRRQLAPAVAVLAAVLALQVVWQDRTIDNWRVSPYAEYSRQYFPFIKPGFGVDPTPASRDVPPEIAWVAEQFAPLHEFHRPANLPAIVLARLVGLFSALGQSWRGVLIVLFVVSVFQSTGALRFAAWSAAALLAGYLIYAHPAGWVVYYAEAFPVFFLVAVVEIRRILGSVLKLQPERIGAVLAASLLLVLAAGLLDVRAARAARDEHSAFHRRAAAVLDSVPGPAVVFVRYPAGHSHHQSLIANSHDSRAARLWVVYDRGTDNHRLLDATDRAAYRLDVGSWSLERLR